MKKLLIIAIGLIFAGTAYGLSIPARLPFLGATSTEVVIPIVSFNGRDLAVQEYNTLKLELKTKVANRNIKPLEYKDAKLWVELINKNLTNCKLINITKDNLIEKLNNCL